jgi:hypothetical protein
MSSRQSSQATVASMYAAPVAAPSYAIRTLRGITGNPPAVASIVAPPEPFVPEQWQGKRMWAIAGQFAGSQDDAERILAPMRAGRIRPEHRRRDAGRVADLPVEQDQEARDGDGRDRQEERQVEEALPARTSSAGTALRRAGPCPPPLRRRTRAAGPSPRRRRG